MSSTLCFEAWQLNVGYVSSEVEVEQLSFDDLDVQATVIGFLDEDGSIFGFAARNWEKDFWLVDIAPDAEIDGNDLRSYLPSGIAEKWNNVLLGSVDSDELYEEADFDFALQKYVEWNSSAQMDMANAEGKLAVHSVNCIFELDSNITEVIDVKKFTSMNLEEAVSVNRESLGEAIEFIGDSDMICVFN